MKIFKQTVKKKYLQKVNLEKFLLEMTSLTTNQLRDVAVKGGLAHLARVHVS